VRALITESPFALDDGLFFASEPSVAGDAAASLDASTAIGAADSSFSSGLGLDLGIRPNHSVHGRFSTHNTAYTTSTFDARPPPGPSLRRKKMDDWERRVSRRGLTMHSGLERGAPVPFF
jgi:hypothetical protein